MPNARIVVVGAGPAGIAAAVTAAEAGTSVTLLDQNHHLGGQIWRSEKTVAALPSARFWLKRYHQQSIETHTGTSVFAIHPHGVIHAEQPHGYLQIPYDRLIIATGGRERFLPFPGWTLPGVMGAGGLQAMVKSGLSIQGHRVVVAGSGPLLLAVADYLLQSGAIVTAVVEQTPWTKLAKFGLGLIRWPSKLWQALRLRWALRTTPLFTDAWVTQAYGEERLHSITIHTSRGKQTVACDWLACGFGSVGNIELPLHLGCQVKNNAVNVNEFMETSIPNVFCVGEPLGIGGIDCSIIEGQIAGLAASGKREDACHLLPRRQKQRQFAKRLEHAFALRPELSQLAQESTIVCRCEDVTVGQLKPFMDWRSAKLQTRCGMGPCQGRICGPATECLFGWQQGSIRPPIMPVRMQSLLASSLKEGESHALARRHACDHDPLS